jgi:AcrR family transcriptional regulator
VTPRVDDTTRAAHTAGAPAATQRRIRRLSSEERERRAQLRRGVKLARHRTRILDAVAHCFAERGYHDTSMDQVVSRARSSKSAFYACFANKETAFAALLEREGERLLRTVEQAVLDETDPRRRARAGISTFVTDCAVNRATARILLVESVGISPAIEERRRALHRRFAGLIRAQAEAARAAGTPATPLDLEVLAFALVGAVNEAVVHLLDSGTSDPAPVVEALGHLAGRALLP